MNNVFQVPCLSLLFELDKFGDQVLSGHGGFHFGLIEDVSDGVRSEGVIEWNNGQVIEDRSYVEDDPLLSVLRVDTDELEVISIYGLLRA